MRSGREGPVDVNGFEVALAGRAGAVPKKSKPRRESPCFVGRDIVGSALLGWGLRSVLSVVLGRAGGSGVSSPNKSMEGGGRLSD